LRIHEEDIYVSFYPQVLISIVQDGHTGMKLGRGVAAREITATADENGNAFEPLSQHVGLITSLTEWQEEPIAVADHPELPLPPSAISPTQDDNTHAFFLEQLGDVFDGRGFSSSPKGNITYADHFTG